MKVRIIQISFLTIIFLALITCVTGCVSESNVSDENNENRSIEKSPEMKQQELTGAGGMDLILEQLEKEGYDLSAIRTAIENGDRETARTMLEQFMNNAPEI